MYSVQSLWTSIAASFGSGGSSPMACASPLRCAFVIVASELTENGQEFVDNMDESDEKAGCSSFRVIMSYIGRLLQFQPMTCRCAVGQFHTAWTMLDLDLFPRGSILAPQLIGPLTAVRL